MTLRLLPLPWPALALALALALMTIPALHTVHAAQDQRGVAGHPYAPATNLTFTVDTIIDAPDANPGDGICADKAGQCTLRAAIQEANAQPGGSAIGVMVPTGIYTLTLSTLRLMTNTIAISGAGSGGTIVDGNGASTVLDIDKGVQASISGVTVSGGKSERSGGGIANAGVLALADSVISNNKARARGGGIANSGTLTLSNTTVATKQPMMEAVSPTAGL